MLDGDPGVNEGRGLGVSGGGDGEWERWQRSKRLRLAAVLGDLATNRQVGLVERSRARETLEEVTRQERRRGQRVGSTVSDTTAE